MCDTLYYYKRVVALDLSHPRPCVRFYGAWGSVLVCDERQHLKVSAFPAETFGSNAPFFPFDLSFRIVAGNHAAGRGACTRVCLFNALISNDTKACGRGKQGVLHSEVIESDNMKGTRNCASHEKE